MKKAIITLGFLLFVSFYSLAGTVKINWAGDSLGSPCQIPQLLGFNVAGTATGYAISDSLDVFVAFGDGQSATTKVSLWGQAGALNWWAWVQHTYTMPGIYTVMYVVTAPDMASDTLIVTNEVVLGSSCDNISGRAYVDDNNNCVYDLSTDAPLAYRSVRLKLGGQTVLQTYTDQDGWYSLSAVSGLSYTLEIESLHPSVTFNCPTGGSYSISSLPATNQDFAVSCVNSQFDLEGQFTGGFVVPGVARPVTFRVGNNLCAPVSGIAKVVLNSQVTYTPSTSSTWYSVPDSINGDTLYFSFTNLFMTGYEFFRVRLKGDTTLTINDSVCLGLFVEPVVGDVDPANNNVHPCLEVRTSYDPNMKTVYPSGEGAEGYILPDQQMLYTLHFQNTGNFMATNIFILDSIDTKTLDLSTLQIVDFSHRVNLRTLDQGILKFEFDNIMLPDSNSNEPESHGYVSFTIDQLPALPDGTRIENKVGIYFDYNPPIITNTVLNTIERNISIKEFGSAKVVLFHAFPNPTSDRLNINLEEGVHEANLKLYDLNGKILVERSITDKSTLDVSALPNGIYLLSVDTKAGSQQKKIVIQ